MPNNAAPIQELYAELIAHFSDDPDISTPLDEPRNSASFGAHALKINGRIIAMLSSRQEFVVKLPAKRVEELVAKQAGKNFDSGRGIRMKEWFVAGENDLKVWQNYVEEARSFAKKH